MKNSVLIGSSTVKKTYFQEKSPKALFRGTLNYLGLEQPIEYFFPSKRAKFELETLILWREMNFDVPRVISYEKCSLTMERIDGESFVDLFCNNNPLQILNNYFIEVNHRHEIAQKVNKKELCHVDANFKNIFSSDNKIIHLDFEMGRFSENVIEWGAREISKFFVSYGLLGHSVTKILPNFLEYYKQEDILLHHIKKNFKKDKSVFKAGNGPYRPVHLAGDLNDIYGKF